MLNKRKGAKIAPFFIHGSIYPRSPWMVKEGICAWTSGVQDASPIARALDVPDIRWHFLHSWRSGGEREDLYKEVFIPGRQGW